MLRIGNLHQRHAHLLHLHGIEQQAPVSVGPDGQRNAPPQELHALLLGMLIFKAERGHVALAAAIEHVHGLAPRRRAALAASMAVLPPPTTTTVPSMSCSRPVLYAAISSSAFITPFVVLARECPAAAWRPAPRREK